uniref:NADH-ubiquinone oxidoreductase chain 6 n=1 Tax=Mimastra sp. REN-2018 TaxID=2506508 RepID=A0A411D9T3_9CUCU|nr:NADH dehydrogenase subunit 6 [Mimastra sp. REN-2018]
MSDMMMFLLAMILFAMLFLMFNHPLSCGFMLLMQTIFTAMITGLMNINYWYSYILFLIMIGGMLILFIYMTSIASNEKFKFSMKLIIMASMMIIFMIFMIFIDFYYMDFFKKMETNYNKMNMLSMMKYFNFPNYFIIIMMMTYLFITLIMTVKMTNFLYGPLRQKF